ncbi:MAG: hypothetical protein RSC68_27155 [Acinetobacter sp.]
MIINLTQHNASPEQTTAGVVDVPAELKSDLSALLTFNNLPTKEEIDEAAMKVAAMAVICCQGFEAPAAMIGGAPYLMAALEAALRHYNIKPLYSFSERVSEEKIEADGTVRKVNYFKHKGFVEV